jgi:Phage terminase-like protein, large subunit
MSNYLEQYADAVLTGKIIASRRIKQQYRILADKLEHPSKYKPYIFDDFLANDHIDFIETFCKQAQGKLGAPLRLELFQKAKFQAAFGFIDENTGLRQYGEVLTIEGRKNGKTTETSAVSLALLINDGEGSPEIYNVATKRDQAGKGFDETWKMIKQSPALRKHIRKRVADLYCHLNMGSIKALASDNLDGLNSHAVTIDELEAIKNRSIYDDMKQSVSSRDQAILFCNSTNGFVREGVFDSQYDYACKVLDGTIIDDAFLAFIYELDSPDEWDDEDMWMKANPGLGTIKKTKTLRGFVEKAKADPAFKPTVLVKDFNLKQNSSVAWLKWEELDNEETYDIEFDYGVGGFDAADSTDLNSAKVLCVRPDDPKIYVRSMYWIPQAKLDAAAKLGKQEGPDNVPYERWVQQGFMRVVEGNKVNKQVILDWFTELVDEGLYIRHIGYDPWHISDELLDRFRQTFGNKSMIEIRQGAKTLSTPMKDIKADFEGKRIVYNNNPIDKWCLYNTEVRIDINGNIQPVKKLDPRLRIDGAVSLLCGYIVLCDNRSDIETLNSD